MSLLKKVGAGLLLAAVISVGFYVVYLRAQVAKRDAALADQVAQASTQAGGLLAEVTNQKAIVAGLSEANAVYLKKMQQVDKRVAPEVHVKAVARVEDTVVLGPEEHRFELAPDLKTLTRRQKFRLDVVVVENVGNEDRLGHVSLEELDPDTGAVLDSEFVLESTLQVVKQAKYVPVFHPRLVAGVEQHGYPLLGAELLNLERFGGAWSHVNAAVFAGYNTREKNVFGGASVNWRLFNSNISLGPAYYYNGHSSFGAAATLELTR